MVYLLRVDVAKFRALEPVDDASFDLFLGGFEGRSMADEWEVPEVRFLNDRGWEQQLQGDFPYLCGAVPVMSAKVVAALGSLLEVSGELLPLASDDGEYWAFNCLAVVDAMDTQRSTADFVAPGRIVVLRDFVPKIPIDELAPIFKLPQWLAGSTLITEHVVELVVRHGLRGLDPRPVMKP